jgi:hypothetical protein
MGPHAAAGRAAAGDARPDPVATALDGATRDSAVSGDAMRWSPDLAALPADLPSVLAAAGELPGGEAATGPGAALGPDGAVRRPRGTGALLALPSGPGAGRRELTAGPGGEPGADGG